MSALNGCNILRYGHMYDSGGGMERYLSDLNGALGRRSAVHLIQVQLTSLAENVGESEHPSALESCGVYRSLLSSHRMNRPLQVSPTFPDTSRPAWLCDGIECYSHHGCTRASLVVL